MEYYESIFHQIVPDHIDEVFYVDPEYSDDILINPDESVYDLHNYNKFESIGEFLLDEYIDPFDENDRDKIVLLIKKLFREYDYDILGKTQILKLRNSAEIDLLIELDIPYQMICQYDKPHKPIINKYAIKYADNILQLRYLLNGKFKVNEDTHEKLALNSKLSLKDWKSAFDILYSQIKVNIREEVTFIDNNNNTITKSYYIGLYKYYVHDNDIEKLHHIYHKGEHLDSVKYLNICNTNINNVKFLLSIQKYPINHIYNNRKKSNISSIIHNYSCSRSKQLELLQVLINQGFNKSLIENKSKFKKLLKLYNELDN